MSTRIAFISGLPRSGSTLLSAILRQNPKFHAEMSSPVNPLIVAVQRMMSMNVEVRAQMKFSNGSTERVLRGVLEAFYADKTDKEIIFDTGRGWTGSLPQLSAFHPDVKMIALLRDPAWIHDSFERAQDSDPFSASALRKMEPIDVRAAKSLSATGFIGLPMRLLKEAVFGEHRKSLMLVEYDALCEDPAYTLQEIYKFVQAKPFAHNFDNVEYSRDDFDEAIGVANLHKVSGPVKKRERRTILPPEVFATLSQSAFWKSGLPTDVRCVTKRELLIKAS